MIPKKIHYCWFGGSPLPELEQKCISSWKMYCPEYEIIEWNESNFDISCCDYVKEAYASQKWAFVSDYARFWIIYHEGGIYLDTDVELIKTIDDVVTDGPYLGCETNYVDGTESIVVAPGLGFAAEAGNKLHREILDFYENSHFLRQDGTQNITTIVSYTTDIIRKYGFVETKEIQKIMGINIYPPEYFCPLNYQTLELTITENTRSIHHYTASWRPQSICSRMKKIIKRIIGPKLTQHILYCKHMIRKIICSR